MQRERGLALRDFCDRTKSLAAEWSERFSGDEKTIDVMDAKTGDAARKILSAAKSPKTRLLVRFSDGTVVSEVTAAATLARAIERIGCDVVAALDLSVNRENLVSRQPSPEYATIKVGSHFVRTHSSTAQKRRHLLQISQELGLGLQVETLS